MSHGAALMLRAAHKSGEDINPYIDFLWISAIGSIVGARFFYVVLEKPEIFINDPLKAFKIWTGGLVFYGGLIVGLMTGIIFCRFKGLHIGKVLDFGAAPLALATGLGRLSCFLSGCCVGAQCNLLWPLGVVFPYNPDLPLVAQRYPDYFLASPMFSAFANIALFFLLLVLRGRRRYYGQLFTYYLLFQSISRFFIDFTRDRDGRAEYIFNALSLSQLYALGLLVLSAALLIYFHRPNRKSYC